MSTGPRHVGEIENISPEKAKQYLDSCVLNRKLNAARVLQYALEMDRGAWVLNGETVKFNHKGNLIDGQHRMEAAILAGKTFMTYVIRGVDDERAFSTIDVGSNRSHADIFSISGITNPNNAAAAATVLFFHKKGLLRNLPGPSGEGRAKVRKMIKGSKFSKIATSISRVNKEELLEFFQPYQHRIAEAIKEIENMHSRKVVAVSIAAAMYVLFSEKDKVAAHEFVRGVLVGEGLQVTDPRYVLRERLIQNNMDTKSKLSRWSVVLFFMKAWNAWRAGERMRYIRIIDNEKFPKII